MKAIDVTARQVLRAIVTLQHRTPAPHDNFYKDNRESPFKSITDLYLSTRSLSICKSEAPNLSWFFYLCSWIGCRDFLDPGGTPLSGITHRPSKGVRAASIAEQTAGSDNTPATACPYGNQGLEGGGSTTENILLQIELMVSAAEIASQMSYSECTQQGDWEGTVRPKRKKNTSHIFSFICLIIKK